MQKGIILVDMEKNEANITTNEEWGIFPEKFTEKAHEIVSILKQPVNHSWLEKHDAILIEFEAI